MSVTAPKCCTEPQTDNGSEGPEPSTSLGGQQEELTETRNPGNTAVLGHVSWVIKRSQLTEQLDW